MWYAVYRQADGALVSVGTSVADDQTLATNGYAKAALGEEWSRGGLAWDATTQSFVAASAPPASLSQLDFLRRFTVQERVAVREAAKTDAIVADFLDLLNRATEIHVDAPDTIAGIGYLVSVSLLTEPRAAEILA